MPSLWEKFKDFATGMTQAERDLLELDREMWQLKRILAWNEEIGRRYFEEDELRARIAALTRQVAEVRRGLPKTSRLKSGPWIEDSFYTNSRREMEDHITYLRSAIKGRGVRGKFPMMDALLRLRLLEDEYRRTYPIIVVNSGGGAYQPGWQPPPRIGGIAPIGWAPPASSNGSPGWSPSSDSSSPGWGPPSGSAVPAGSDSSSPGWGPPSSGSDSSPGWGPPSGGAVPI